MMINVLLGGLKLVHSVCLWGAGVREGKRTNTEFIWITALATTLPVSCSVTEGRSAQVPTRNNKIKFKSLDHKKEHLYPRSPVVYLFISAYLQEKKQSLSQTV